MSAKTRAPRGPRKRWLALALLAVLTLVALILVVSKNERTPSIAATAGDPANGITPSTYATLGASTSAPSPTGTAITGTVGGKPMAGFGSGAPGLVGNGWANSEPSHTVVLHAWSTAPIPAMGWWVPTAHGGGKLIGKVSDWSHTFTAYGNPKYAQLYLATDYRGIRVYCTITVDGVVQASGHSSGPFGDVMCMA